MVITLNYCTPFTIELSSWYVLLGGMSSSPSGTVIALGEEIFYIAYRWSIVSCINQLCFVFSVEMCPRCSVCKLLYISFSPHICQYFCLAFQELFWRRSFLYIFCFLFPISSVSFPFKTVKYHQLYLSQVLVLVFLNLRWFYILLNILC